MPINPTQGTPSTGADPGNFGNLQISGLFAESVATYVPFNGGGQSSATKITTELAYIPTTVATSAPYDSIMLPPTSLLNVIGAGLTLYVINKSVNPIQVFGSGSDTIDGVAASAGVQQMQQSLVLFTCVAPGIWTSDGLAMGWGGPGLSTSSNTNGITAHAGGGQAGAVPLLTMQNRITTAGVGGTDSVALPTAAPGMNILVINATANSCAVWPVNGGSDQINALGANAAFTLTTGSVTLFYCCNLTQWHTK